MDSIRDFSSKSRILNGSGEAIFSALPNQVLANLRHSGSENALVWNLIYPLAKPTINLTPLMALAPLWGTLDLNLTNKILELEPYYWGFNIDGEPLPALASILERIDGSGPKTEIDLFLAGKTDIVLIEAKHLSGLGRCSRYAKHRCPQIHLSEEDRTRSCRYWQPGEQAFGLHLEFGSRPMPGDHSPACSRHYQLARTLLVGAALAKELGLHFHLWLILPRSRWRSMEKTWIDFAERVRDECLWRNMRVLAWEDVQSLSQ
jgi:hypothetical protein